MAKSRLHELSEQGRQRLDRLALARDARDRGARAADPTRTPSSASPRTRRSSRRRSRRRLVRRAAARGAAKTEDDPTEIFLELAIEDIQRRLRPAPAGLGRTQGAGRLRLARGRPDARLRPRGDVRAGDAPARGRRPAEPVREDPGDEARARRDRGLDRAGQVDQRHADLLAGALRGGRRGLPPRARAARRGRRRPVARRLGGELLRLARRHRGRPAARGDRRQRRAAGQARDREREARLPALPGDVLRPALGVPRRQGRDAAALPLGLDLDEEPGLPRRALRRGADRPGHGQHDARRDDRGVPGPRRGRGDTLSEGVDEAEQLLDELREAGVDYDDVVETLEAEGVQKFADSFEELLEGIRAKRGELAAA